MPSKSRSRTSTYPSLTNSAAAEGVGARRSATKSEMLKSTSWPTAEITGTGDTWIARARPSSLNSHRSSSDPPPRPTMIVSTRPDRASFLTPSASSRAAPWPWTRAGKINTGTDGARRPRMFRISRIAAPAGDVTTPMHFGKSGNARLRSGAKSPSFSSFAFSSWNCCHRTPSPCRVIAPTFNWYWPRLSKTLIRPWHSTSSPSAGSNSSCIRPARHITQLSSAPSSLIEKYAWPDPATVQLLISPTTETSGKRSSSCDRI